MAKAKKMLSLVLAALMLVFTCASYVPAQAAKALAGPTKLVIQQQPEKEYSVGDRVLVKFNCPDYKGIVQYRAFLWNRTEQKFVQEIYQDFPGYWYKPVCVGKSVFTIDVFYPQTPGVYYIGVLVRAKGSKGGYSTYKYTDTFTVKAKELLDVESIAPVADITVSQNEKVQLPETVTLNLADKTTREAKVTEWTTVDTSKVGEVTAEGTVEGTDKKATVKVIVKATDLKVEKVAAIKANKLEVTLNNAVDTAKTTMVVKKGSILANVSKTEWSEDKKVATLTMTSKLTKGDYTVNVTTDAFKDVLGTVTVEDEKITKIEFANDKLVMSDANYTEGKVGYTVMNQYGEDISAKVSSIQWNVAPGTYSAAKGVLTITKADKFILDQKVIVTALETTTGIFAQATLTVSREAYINEVVIGDPKTDDSKITVLNVANIAKYYLPVELKDQYGNVIDDVKFANNDKELLKIKSNIDGEFDADEDGNLIFVLKPVAQQIAGKALVQFVSTKTGVATAKASKEFAIAANADVAEVTMEFPEIIAAGDTDVEVKFSAVDQYGNQVTDLTKLNALIANLGVSGANLSKANFRFVKDAKTGAITLLLDASKAVAGRVFLSLLTPANKVFTTNFEVKAARKYVVISGVSKLTTTYVKGATSKITAKNINVLDQYGQTWSVAKVPVKINLTNANTDVVNVAGTSGAAITSNSSVTVEALAAGTATINMAIDGVADSDFALKLNVVAPSKVVTYEVEDISTLNGNIGASADIAVTGKLADGTKVVLNDAVIKGILTSNASIATVDKAAKTVTAVKKDDTTLDDATVKISVIIEGPTEAITITKDVKVSYKKAVPAKITINTDDNDVVEGVAYIAGTTDLKTLFAVEDQYGTEIADALTLVITNKKVVSGKIVSCSVTAFTSNGLTANVKVVYNEGTEPADTENPAKPVEEKAEFTVSVGQGSVVGTTIVSVTITKLPAGKTVDTVTVDGVAARFVNNVYVATVEKVLTADQAKDLVVITLK